MGTAAERFAALYDGFTRAHGRYTAKHKDDRGKVIGRAITVSGPPNYADHLAGVQSIGVIPLREDDTLLFAAIDVDKYTLDIHDVAARVASLALPLLCCRSKSGGVHLYLFLSTPHDADLVRKRMEDFACLLGVGGSEIFPKQSYRATAEDVGNWINLPYAAGVDRVCCYDGSELPLDAFLALAERMRTTLPSAPSCEAPAAPEQLRGAPPCLCHHATHGGAPDGHKHETLYGAITYARKRWPDTWQQKVHELNPLLFSPALATKDVDTVIKSLGRKSYDYQCQGPWCNKSRCRAAEYGRGTTGGGSCDIGQVVKIVGDPVFWIIEIDGRRVRCTTMQLQSQLMFGRLCMDILNRCPPTMSAPRWTAYLDSKLQTADVVDSPVEATMRGRVRDMLRLFLLSQNRRALERDELMIGKPWVEDGRGLFQGRALLEFMIDRRFAFESPHDVWCHVRDLGGASSVVRVGSTTVRCWSVPMANLEDDQ